jgi:hypothetical protein
MKFLMKTDIFRLKMDVLIELKSILKFRSEKIEILLKLKSLIKFRSEKTDVLIEFRSEKLKKHGCFNKFRSVNFFIKKFVFA